MIVQFLGALLVTDLMSYFAHYVRHKVRWFWFFHTIHHSQENLNPFTNYRVHAFETIINTAIRTIPMAFVGGSAARWTWFVVIDVIWHCFIHANVRTTLGPLGRIIVSPQFHRIHHSSLKEHYDVNYGERLVLWDWLFGTLHPDKATYPPTGVNGLESWSVERAASLRGLVTVVGRPGCLPLREDRTVGPPTYAAQEGLAQPVPPTVFSSRALSVDTM